MSYMLRNKDHQLLFAFCETTSNGYQALATNFKQFFVQKQITSKKIDEKFNESDTRIKIPLTKVIKIMKECEPIKCDIKFRGKFLELDVKYPINTTKLTDSFQMDFLLEEFTCPAEIGEYFMGGLLKTIIDLKSNKELDLPQKTFEVTLEVNEKNISDLCKMIGVENKCEISETEEMVDNAGESSVVSTRGLKRPVSNQKFTFEKLDDSQELEVLEKGEGTKLKKVTKHSKNKFSVKF